MQQAKFIAIVLALNCSLAGAQTPERMAKLTESNVLLREATIEGDAMHACQPLKGDTVAILEIKNDTPGATGIALAHVRVMSGHCRGQIGWIGMPRLEALAR
ncbi:hypothetical protein CLU93_2574 [Janthinobacterium sp. 35]|uniref:hypothetical protein n=1 Tax=Janthinobacterium sp. 35 TaxID=2035210 RepID=UPI000C18D6F9|nr:hypothetical protein [Janthinobacterium sp. 35]PIG28294.1 hypothetical protein CLU93_2574 [Janthinobacterium sp. 35]